MPLGREVGLLEHVLGVGIVADEPGMKLDRVEARARLKLRRDPYWQRLSEGRYIGFRKMTAGSEGTWLARYYDGERNQQTSIGPLDHLDPGRRYDEAKKAAEEWFGHRDNGGSTKPGTVGDACRAYVAFLKAEKRDAIAADTNARLERFVYNDPIARIDLPKLATHHVTAWRGRIRQRGSASSFNRNATSFRAALNHAKAQGRVAPSSGEVVDAGDFGALLRAGGVTVTPASLTPRPARHWRKRLAFRPCASDPRD